MEGFIHEPFSLNDHFLSVAKLSPIGIEEERSLLLIRHQSDRPSWLSFSGTKFWG